MDDLDRVILETYLKLAPQLEKNPGELRARLARRQTGALNRPPRPWCLAMRASDTRINNDSAIIVPYQAVHSRTQPRPHQVIVNAQLVRHLCTEVELLPNTDWSKCAKRLGTHPESLRHGMRSGRFRLHYYKLLGGKRGKPVPVFLNYEMLDPTSGRNRLPTDPLWGSVWRYAAANFPESFEQTIDRRPAWVAYRGSPRFRGYRWLCPKCERFTRMLYYPLPPYNIPRYLDHDPSRSLSDSVACLKPSSSTSEFACHLCHRIRFFSRMNHDSWNQFITHVTGGLLYGHEVPRPAEFNGADQRKRKYRPSLNRPPSKRREQVLELLMQGHPSREIAEQLRIGPTTVNGYIAVLYKQNNVHSREELAKKLSHALPAPAPSAKLQEIERLLEVGQTDKQIARLLKLTVNAVRLRIRRIRNMKSLPILQPNHRDSFRES